MLQQSALSGALFLAGIWAGSGLMAIGGIFGALSGLGTARLGGFDREAIDRGWYGFNGALVGIALFAHHAPGIPSLLLIIVGGALASLLMHVMLRWGRGLPPYTAPFVLSTWAMLAIAAAMGLAGAAPASAPGPGGEFFAVLRGLGQVMFQDSWLSGALFAAGLALCSWPAAAWAVVGSALGLLIARILHYPDDLAMAGIFGFNAALAGVALSSRFRSGALAPLLGIVLSTVALRGFQLAGFPALTAPFVLASWAVILLARFRGRPGADRG